MNRAAKLLHRVALLAILLGASTAALARPLAELYPATAPFFLEVRDLTQLETAWRPTGFNALYELPAMQPFWQDVREKQGGVLPNELLGCPWSSLKQAATAGAAFGLCPTTDSGLGRLLLADCSGNPQGAFDAYSATVKSWKDAGATVRSIALAGVTMIEGRSATPANQPANLRFVFVHRDMLVIADRAALAQEVIARLGAADANSLAAQKDFQQVMSAASADEFTPGAVRWYVQPWLLWKSSLNAANPSDKASLARLEFYHRQGFAAVSAMGGAVQFGGDRDATHQTRIVAKPPFTKAAGMLHFLETADLAPPPFVPGTADAVAVCNWDIPSAIKGYASAYDEIYGENYDGAFDELLESIENEPEGPEAKLRQDLLARLSSKVLAVTDYGGQKTAANAAGRRTLLACRTSDPAKTQTAIERFFAGEKEIAVVDHQGIHVLAGKRPQIGLLGRDAENPFSLDVDAMCVAADHFMIASDRSLLFEILDRSKQPPAPRPFDDFFTTSASAGNSSARVFRRLDPLLAANFAQMKSARPANAPPSTSLAFDFLLAQLTGAKVDAKKLPDFDTVRGHLGAETMSVRNLKDGWMIDGRIQRAEK